MEVFFRIIDQLPASLRYRLAAYESVCHKFGFLAKLFDLSNGEIKAASTNLVKEYKNDLETFLEFELAQFSIFSI